MTTTTATQRTAAQAYQENAMAIDNLMRTIKNELFRHKHQAAAEPKDWGYAGDLTHYRELLQRIANDMTNTEGE